jgi:hypothetical protein
VLSDFILFTATALVSKTNIISYRCFLSKKSKRYQYNKEAMNQCKKITKTIKERQLLILQNWRAIPTWVAIEKSWIYNATYKLFLAFFADNRLIGFLAIYVNVIPGFYILLSTVAFDDKVSYVYISMNSGVSRIYFRGGK